MSSSERMRATEPAPAEGDAFIDWGLPLPQSYEGERARVMMVEPRMVRVAWESRRDGVRGWQVRAEGARGEELAMLDLGADVSEAWLRVPASTRGLVRLTATTESGSMLVATLPFETPAEGPAADRSERWARVGADGRLTEMSAPPGRPVDGLPGAYGAGHTTKSSSSAKHARRS
jgi:hypothetical protein